MEAVNNNNTQRITRLFKNIWNFFSLDIGWLACILGAASGWFWLGPATVLSLFIIHIILIERNKVKTVVLVGLLTMLIGFFTDTLLIIIGSIEPKRWLLPSPLTTIWDLAIWVNFSLALNNSLRFLQNKLFLATILGATISPATYYAGDRLGALDFSEPLYISFIWIGVLWMLVMPCLSLLSKRLYKNDK